MATSRPNRTISQFKSELSGGGARPNLFEVELSTFPAQYPLTGMQVSLDLCASQQHFLLKTLQQSTFLLEEESSRYLETEPLIHGLLPLSTMKTSHSEEHSKIGQKQSQDLKITLVLPIQDLTWQMLMYSNSEEVL